MANTETLESIAELLPHTQREHFLAMIVQFKTVPDDDEYLQILNAIGFMTLLWKEVPNEVKTILDGANPVTETCNSVAKHLQQAVTEAIPSYEDLKLISKRLEEHELALKNTLSIARRSTKSNTVNLGPFVSLIVGCLIGFFAPSFISLLFPQ